MKSTGIIRKVDKLGRVVLPQELRDTLDIPEQTPLEISIDDNLILLKKYQPGCIFCSSDDDVSNFKGKKICLDCKKGLKKF